jgi:hypothetical protein
VITPGTPVALASAKGAPGVTTTALLLAALLPPAVLVEADSAGCDLRCWLAGAAEPPLRADIGVVSLLASHRTAGPAADRGLLAHTQQLPGGPPLLVGPGTQSQAAALAPSWPLLADAVRVHPGLVLLDLGRLSQSSPSWALVDAAVLTIVLTAPNLAAVTHTRELLAQLRARQASAGLLVIGSDRQHAEVTEALDNRLAWTGRIPDDAVSAAQVLTGAWTRRLDRSPLLAYSRRTATSLYETLVAARAQAVPDHRNVGSIPYPADPEQTWATGIRP